MPANTPVHTPAGFAPAFALGYSDEDGNLVLAKSSAPIPVSAGDRARPGALEGSTAASAIVGPFSPVSQISVMLELAGEWTGTVQLQRSSDGG